MWYPILHLCVTMLPCYVTNFTVSSQCLILSWHNPWHHHRGLLWCESTTLWHYKGLCLYFITFECDVRHHYHHSIALCDPIPYCVITVYNGSILWPWTALVGTHQCSIVITQYHLGTSWCWVMYHNASLPHRKWLETHSTALMRQNTSFSHHSASFCIPMSHLTRAHSNRLS